MIPAERDWSAWKVEVPEVPTGGFPLDTIESVMNKPHPNNGSNNWVVDASKSYSGNPILANDPHLGLNLPSIWIAMQLTTPEKNTYGKDPLSSYSRLPVGLEPIPRSTLPIYAQLFSIRFRSDSKVRRAKRKLDGLQTNSSLPAFL